MKTYIALFQGPSAKEARPLLATSDAEIIRQFTRLLRRRLPGSATEWNRPEHPETGWDPTDGRN